MAPRSCLLFLSFAGLLGGSPDAGAVPVACTSIATGNWNAAATWNAACRIAGGNDTDGPGPDDTATIANGHTVTVTLAGGARSAGSLTINAGANNAGVTLLHDLTVTNASGGSGNVIVNGPTSNGITKQIDVGARTLTVTGSVTLNGGTIGGTNATRTTQLTVSTGVASIGGNLNVTGAPVAGAHASLARAEITGTGRISVTGNAVVTGGGDNTNDAIILNSGANVSPNGFVIGGNLSVLAPTVVGSATVQISSTGRVAVTGSVTNNDVLTIGTGTLSAGSLATTALLGNATTAVTGGQILVTGNATVTASTTNTSTATLSVSTGTIDIDGNLTVTGGNNASLRNAVVNVTGAPAVGRLGLNVDGDLTIDVTTGSNTSAMVAITPAAPTVGQVNVRGATGVTNEGTIRVDEGAFNVTNTAASLLNSSATVVANVRVQTGSLTIEGTLDNATSETISVTSGSITVGNTITYAGTVTNSGTISMTNAAGVFNANGNFTSSGAFTKTAAATLNLRGATSVINGSFTRSTGTVNMNGNAAQALSGTAIQTISATSGFHDFTINNAAGVTIGNNVSVNDTTTFTAGNVTTGANTLITFGNAGAGNCTTPSVSRTSGHVVGNLQKVIPAGASSCTFEIGTGASYAPVIVTYPAGTTTGNMIASTTGGDHPSIGSSAMDSTKSVNRYWTLTNSSVGIPPAGVQANFNFVTPSDYDVAGDPAKFTVQRFSAGWSNTTANSTCTPIGGGAHLCNQINGQTVFNDFAIAEANYTAGNPGWFNVFETSTGAGATVGSVYTKLHNAAYGLDIVAVNALRNGVKPNYGTNPITVDVLDATDNSGALNAETDCRASWTVLQSTGFSPAWTNSRATVTIPALTTAKRETRLRVTQGTLVGCSTDNYAIRPTGFTVTSTNATQTDSSGGPAFAAGSGTFNLTAASGVTGYTGTPAVDNTLVVGNPNTGTGISGSFSAAPTGTGTASGSSFTYAEVGNFGLNLNTIYDDSFTSVDPVGTDCTNDFSNSLDGGGRYGCKFGSAAVPLSVGPAGTGFGRFIPHNFNVAYNSPEFGAGCGTFSYVGNAFTYGTAPVMTVTARNSSNVTTQNYQGVYMKLTNASLTPGTQGARYSRFDALGGGATPGLDAAGLPATGGDPAIGAFASGVGTLTFSSGTGLGFLRSTTTPNAPFNADIRLELNVIDTDAVAFAGNPAAFGTATSGGGISFTGGNKAMRFGRLRMLNASAGSPAVPLSIPIRTEYWNVTGFVLNTSDSCTTLVRANITLGTYAKSLAACETITSATVTFTNGVGTLALTAPGTGNGGSVNLSPQLGSTFTGKYCTAVGGPGNEADPTPAAKSYLQGAWTGATYDQNPTGRAVFGVYGAQPKQFIFFRENY